MFDTLAQVSVSLKQKYNAYLFTFIVGCFVFVFQSTQDRQFCDKWHRLVTDKLTLFFGGGLIYHIYSLPHSNLKCFFFFFLIANVYTKLYDCFNRPTCSYTIQMFEVGTILCF